MSSTGTDAAAFDADLADALSVLIGQGVSLDTAAWVMHPSTALYLATLRSSGQLAYPGVTVRGGTLMGLPVLTSAAVGDAGDSPGEAVIELVAASEVLLADDGEAELDTSQAGALEMDSSPTGGARQLVPLWQNNLAGIKCTRTVNWRLRRAIGAVLLGGINL